MPSTIHTGQFRLNLDGLERVAYNMATLEGISAILDFILGSSGPNSFYIGLIDNVDYISLDIEDTGGSHPGWIELEDYTYHGSTTSRIGPVSVGDNTISNGILFLLLQPAFQAIFTADAKVKGLFLASGATKGSGGLLMAAAQLFPAQDVLDSQHLIASYLYDVNSINNKTYLPLQ